MIKLEQLADGSVSDSNFQRLMSLVIDTGGQSIGVRFGTTTISWTAAATDSANTTGIVHGLGRTPIVVWVFPIAIAFTHISYAQAFSITSTTFTAAGYTPTAPGANTSVTHGWVAIG